jgi:hypothetical protein
MTTKRDDICPKCGTECIRDSVDVGVGVIDGPYGCPGCGWSEDSTYDLSAGKDPIDDRGGVTDQYGGYWPPGSTMALAYRLAREAERALEMDGEKLRALTGEDHGPWKIDSDGTGK